MIGTFILQANLAGQLVELRDSPLWQAVFEVVPCHVFAPRFALHDPRTGGFVEYDTADPDPQRRSVALAAAYTDDTLITRFDERGIPTSSSTRPSLMAAMLVALDARREHRVLEIGTGTGYNAALLCATLGQDNVTTIDVQPELVATARAALATAGYTPVVRCGDGVLNVLDQAPFDRIIVTCGVARVPTTWIAQLAPDGAMLVNISVGIALPRRTCTGVAGRFRGSAGFMPLPSPTRCSPTEVQRITAGTPDSTHRYPAPPDLDSTTAAFFANLVADHGLLILVTDTHDRPSAHLWAHPRSRTWARAELHSDHAIVAQAGPQRLWAELAPLLDGWRDAGYPPPHQYGLAITDDGQHNLWLDHPDYIVGVLHP